MQLRLSRRTLAAPSERHQFGRSPQSGSIYADGPERHYRILKAAWITGRYRGRSNKAPTVDGQRQFPRFPQTRTRRPNMDRPSQQIQRCRLQKPRSLGCKTHGPVAKR